MTGTELQLASPEQLGLDPERWERVLAAAQRLCAEGTLPALSLQVQCHGLTTGVHAFGVRRLDGSAAAAPDTLYLVASLTKPMIAMAVLLLVERGILSLNARVVDLLPQFREPAKRPITLRHLLTHTSGLPDMLPDNAALRKAQAPLSRFVEGTCTVELLFPPGRAASYQSMGYALLGPIIDKAAQMPYQEFLRQEVFLPLGMTRTWLGLPAGFAELDQLAEIRVPEAQRGGDDWNWNSAYWRQLGAPWGGVIASTQDISRFCRAMLTGGQAAQAGRLFSTTAVHEATTNRLEDFAAISDADRRTRGWGYGWRMNWRDHRGSFCELSPGKVFGHWGATGTLCWIDRERELAATLLSTEPLGEDVSPLTTLSNMIAAASTPGRATAPCYDAPGSRRA